MSSFKIEKNSWLTAGSKIMGSSEIGENTFIAGGSLISHNIKIGKKVSLVQTL